SVVDKAIPASSLDVGRLAMVVADDAEPCIDVGDQNASTAALAEGPRESWNRHQRATLTTQRFNLLECRVAFRPPKNASDCRHVQSTGPRHECAVHGTFRRMGAGYSSPSVFG